MMLFLVHRRLSVLVKVITNKIHMCSIPSSNSSQNISNFDSGLSVIDSSSLLSSQTDSQTDLQDRFGPMTPSPPPCDFDEPIDVPTGYKKIKVETEKVFYLII